MTALFNRVNWEKLVEHASRLRSNVGCSLSTSYTSGYSYLVRRLTFTDGVSWVAKIQRPEIDARTGGALPLIEVMRLEMGTAKYIKYGRQSF